MKKKFYVIVQNENGTNYRLASCKRYFAQKKNFNQYGNKSYYLEFTEDLLKAKRYSSIERAKKAFKSITNGWFEVKEIELSKQYEGNYE